MLCGWQPGNARQRSGALRFYCPAKLWGAKMFKLPQKTISARPYLAVLAALFVLWFFAAVWITNRYTAWQGGEMAMQAALKTHESHKRFDYGLEGVVDILYAVPAALSRDADIRRLLETGDAEKKARVAYTLSRLAREIRFVHSFYVLDNQGRVVAAGYTGEAADRAAQHDVLLTIKPGRTGAQYGMDIKTGGGGKLYFSAPVYDGDHLLGAVAARMEWEGLAGLLGQSVGFVADRQGVVVAAVRPGFLMTALPDAAVYNMPEAERLARYGRKDFAAVPLTLVREHEGVPLFSLGEGKGLYFLHMFKLPGGQLRLMVAEAAPSPSGWQPFFLVSLMCGWLSILVVTGVVYHFRQRRAAEYSREQQIILKKMVTHDALTGAYSRIAAERLMEQACMQAEKSGTGCALLFVDLDKFKDINDGHGHSAGDIVLRETGMRLQSCVRHSDAVVRYGGDEFLVILAAIYHASHVANVAATILTSLAQPVKVEDGSELCISASIGIALYPHDGTTFAELSAHADEALYRAKDSGRARFVFYTDRDAALPGLPDSSGKASPAGKDE